MLEELTYDAQALIPQAGPPAVLALAGPPAAGKSLLAHALVARLHHQLVTTAVGYVPLDGFHLSNRVLHQLGRWERKGAPDTFDAAGYVALLRRIRQGEPHPVYAPDYDRELAEPVAARHVIAPQARLVVTEGNYLAWTQPPWDEIRQLVTQLWYVDADDALREARLHERQQRGGLSAERAREWVARSDHPNAELVKESRGRCDRLVRLDGAELPGGDPGQGADSRGSGARPR